MYGPNERLRHAPRRARGWNQAGAVAGATLAAVVSFGSGSAALAAPLDVLSWQTSLPVGGAAPKTVYDLPGYGTGQEFPNTKRYDVTYNGAVERLDRIHTAAGSYDAGRSADVVARRSAGPDTEIIWYRGTGDPAQRPVTLAGPAVPNVPHALAGNNVLVGGDNVFANLGDATNNNTNIERLDFIFTGGITAAASRGFGVFDRGAVGDHDAFAIVAITALDDNNAPAGYGAPIAFGLGAWGNSALTDGEEYVVLRKDRTTVNAPFRPSHEFRDQIGGVFVATADLAQAGTTIYGFSLIAADVTGSGSQLVNWQDGTVYPSDTPNDNVDAQGRPQGDHAGGLDLVGVSAVLFEQSPAVPEPASAAALALGATGLLLRRRNRR